MKLTGKAKEDFEKWYLKTPLSVRFNALHFFYEDLSNSMQYGVLVDWFDSVGYDVSVSPWKQGGEILYLFCAIELGKASHYPLETSSKTRPEARTKAIEKASKIYNESN